MIDTQTTLLLGTTLFLAVALVAGNNLSACVGTLVGSGAIRKNTGVLIGILGYITGLLLQGGDMGVVSKMLFPVSSPDIVSGVLIVTILVFVTGNALKVPVSLSMSLVGLMIGVSISKHLPVYTNYAYSVATLWVVAPIVAILAGALSVRAINASKPRNVWRRATTYRTLLLVASFLASYVLGANTLGVIVAVAGSSQLNVLIAIVAVITGSTLLGGGALQRVGRGMFSLRYSNAFVSLMDSVILVETGTLLGLPLSNTQTLTSSLFGAGLTHKERFLSAKPFTVIVIGWIIASLVSFAIGLLI